MRRRIGMILVGVGAFFIAVALLFRFYVAHQLIAAPANTYERTTLEANNATYLDAGKLTVRQGATLKAVNTTRGDVHATTGDIAVWDSFTSVDDPSNGVNLEIQSQRAVFDRRTGELRNGHGAAIDGDTSVHQSGIGVFWPIGVKKKTYQYFDTSTKRTWPMVYQGEEKIHGLKVYRFVQQIPPTVIESVEGGVPATLVGLQNPPATFPGLDPETGNVAADRVSQATVTAWVDPRTGAQVSQEQKTKTVLRTKDGVDRLVVADLDLKVTDASQKHLVDVAKSKGLQIMLVKTLVPVLGLIIGIVLLVLGLVFAASRRSPAVAPATAGGPAEGSGPPAEDAPSQPEPREPSP